jgi:hypothetical protein
MHHQTHRLSVSEKGWGFFLRGSVVIQGRKVFDLFFALLLGFVLGSLGTNELFLKKKIVFYGVCPFAFCFNSPDFT